MKIYIIEFSRYFICASFLLYTTAGFLTFRYRGEAGRRKLYILQYIGMALTQAGCFLQIAVRTKDPQSLLLLSVETALLYAVIILFAVLYPDGSRLVINNMCMLLSIGMFVLTRLDPAKSLRQFLIAMGAVALGIGAVELVYRWERLKDFAWAYAGAGLAALSAVLLLGSVTHGSKLSYTLFGLTFQPSEAVKLLFILFIAGMLQTRTDFRRVALTGVLAAAHVLVLVMSKDLGSAAIFCIVFVLMIFVATGNPLYLLLGAAGGTGAAYLAWRLFAHVQVRVSAWLNPWEAIDSTGYQIAQSLFGISTGGWFGLGLFGGLPSAIPYVELDSIFSAIAEELGVIFAVCVIGVCLSTFLMFLYQARRLRDPFYRLTAFGIGVAYIFQVFLTIGGGTKFIPLTGVTLPLVSYGGTSVLVTILMFSIFEGICRIRTDEHYDALAQQEARGRRPGNGRAGRKGVKNGETGAPYVTRSGSGEMK